MLNAFLDVWSNACYTQGNAEQDHDFSGDRCRATRGSDGLRRAIVHPRQRAKSKGLSGALLCQYDVLCHVAKEYSSFVPAARQEWLRVGDKRDTATDGVCSAAESINGKSLSTQN